MMPCGSSAALIRAWSASRAGSAVRVRALTLALADAVLGGMEPPAAVTRS